MGLELAETAGAPDVGEGEETGGEEVEEESMPGQPRRWRTDKIHGGWSMEMIHAATMFFMKCHNPTQWKMLNFSLMHSHSTQHMIMYYVRDIFVLETSENQTITVELSYHQWVWSPAVQSSAPR